MFLVNFVQCLIAQNRMLLRKNVNNNINKDRSFKTKNNAGIINPGVPPSLQPCKYKTERFVIASVAERVKLILVNSVFFYVFIRSRLGVL